MKLKVKDNRAITVEIDGEAYDLTLEDVQRLYDALGAVSGVRKHQAPRINVYPTTPYYPPYWSTGTVTTAPNMSPAYPNPRFICSSIRGTTTATSTASED